MTINKAIEHFKYKLSNVWKPTKHDVVAFNKLVDFVNDKHQKQLKQNELFAKLYVFAYAYYIKHYNSNVFSDIPRKELHQLLDKPLEMFIQRFTDRINEQELEQLYKNNNIDVLHPMESKKHTTEEIAKLNDILLEHEKWSVEDVAEQMYAQINNVLNEFNR